ncbi:alpha/beta fold hydrolase [Dermatophilaceae bacterium Soc4.6]
MPTPTADVRWEAQPSVPTAVVLVLHGGQEESTRRNAWWAVPVWWMVPFARTVRRAGDGTFAVARVRYAVRGWNGVAQSPLTDVRVILEDAAARYPGVPVALVGHSMGGRVALRLMGDERVSSVVALAPWVAKADVEAELHEAHPELRLLIVHGLSDTVTSPRASGAVVRRLQADGVAASFVGLARAKHSMIRRRRLWDRLLTAHLRATLLGEPLDPALSVSERAALAAGTVAHL